ncbi:DUF3099 domain-containing protein [Corynebacterium sp. sy039]|uniref:DUF3099 domain-containing protein n=1 Tax=Corynebacterium sp. sy039 TaxID=2599641 RepID=UPI001AEFB89F|nr:DUF3099 domain-containing protein [Corynebacterium sp. sy039]
MSNFRGTIVEHEQSSDDDFPSRRPRIGQILDFVSRPMRRRTAVLITDAKQSPEQNRKRRKKTYTWLQGLRIPFLLLAALTYFFMHNIALSTILFLVSIPLPWIAVVIANETGQRRDKREQQVYKPALMRAQQEISARQAALEEHHTQSKNDREHSTNTPDDNASDEE